MYHFRKNHYWQTFIKYYRYNLWFFTKFVFLSSKLSIWFRNLLNNQKYIRKLPQYFKIKFRSTGLKYFHQKNQFLIQAIINHSTFSLRKYSTYAVIVTIIVNSRSLIFLLSFASPPSLINNHVNLLLILDISMYLLHLRLYYF